MPQNAQTFQFLPDPVDVRRALDQVTTICGRMLPQGTAHRIGDIQIALAEALNNIAEHAFTGLAVEPVHLKIAAEPDRLCVTIRERGRPLPPHLLDPPVHQDLSVGAANLPEGGFGWMLIHELTNMIDYVRENDENRLTLCFDLHRLD